MFWCTNHPPMGVLYRQRLQYPLFALIMSLLFLLGATAAWGGNSGWQPLAAVRKASYDPRQYQAIQLDNGMKLLLISDPKASYSTTAVGLPVGSLQDPVEQLGLAHYLEHLLFLGSENYPEGIEVGHNAWTSGHQTVYTASVRHHGLAVTLDKFADALAAPRFEPKVAEKERHSVHHEALLRRDEDDWRILQINRETLNPHHPFARFVIGNLETLADKPNSLLLQAVSNFHQRYYSANVMVAVIYSNQPLAALAHMAVESYGRIPDRQAVVSPLIVPLATAQEQGVMIHYVPKKSYDALKIDFVITPDWQDDLLSQTNHYLSRLLISRSDGTLASWLQRQGLATDVNVSFNPRLAGNGGLLSINIAPTQQGMLQQDTIFAAVFRYLQLIEKQGIQQRYFKQMTQILQLQARQAGYSPFDQGDISALTDHLLTYPIKDVVLANTTAHRYRPAAIRQYLASLTANQARVWVTSPHAPRNRATYFFQAPYQIEPLTAKKLACWHKIGQTLSFKLPDPNPYLPTDFSIVTVKQPVKKPQSVMQTDGIHAWLMPSQHFGDQPRIDVTIALRKPTAVNTMRDMVYVGLLDELIQLKLQEFGLQANDAGAFFSLEQRKGIVIKAQGFSQKLPLLLTQLVEKIQSIDFEESELLHAKREYLRYWDNLKKEAPHRQAIRVLDELSWINYGELTEQRALLDRVTRAALLAYRERLFQQASLDILAVGNLSESQLCTLAKSLQRLVPTAKIEPVKKSSITINKPIKALINQMVSAEGSALSTYYLPTGYDQLTGKAISHLLAGMLHGWFFDQLRTQEQLGYVAGVSSRSLGQQWGLTFTLQSGEKTPAQLYERYQAFYQQAWQYLQKLTDPREFAAYQRNVLKVLQQQPGYLGEEVSPLRQDFLDNHTTFDAREQLIARIKALTAEEVLRFYRQAVLEPTGLALLSQVQGTSDALKQDPKNKNSCFAAPVGWHHYPTVAVLQQQLLVENAKPKRG